MTDVIGSVSFAVALSVFLGWCLWRACKPEINLRARAGFRSEEQTDGTAARPPASSQKNGPRPSS
jgi:hypothetical protein